MAVSILALSASPCSAALSKGEPLAKPYTSQLNRKLYRHAKASPFDRFPPVGGRCRASDRKGNEVDANAVSRRRGRGRCPCAPNAFSREGKFLFLRKKSQDLAKQAGQNRKIRAIAHFNELKTYKSAKKISLFLVRLLSGLRLLYGRNLLL